MLNFVVKLLESYINMYICTPRVLDNIAITSIVQATCTQYTYTETIHTSNTERRFKAAPYSYARET